MHRYETPAAQLPPSALFPRLFSSALFLGSSTRENSAQLDAQERPARAAEARRAAVRARYGRELPQGRDTDVEDDHRAGAEI